MSMYDKLNEQQKEAVFCTEGPLLILAGAGSGKTSVLTHRIAYLIDEVGVNPYNILAITFTNKAAGEMRERVDKIVGFGSEQIFVSTFHSMCVRILRRHIDCLGYDNSFTIYDTDDQKQVIKEVCKKLEIDTKKIKERTIQSKISSCKDELVTPDDFYLETMGDFQMRKIADCYKEYQATLKKNNALDFDDLLMKTVELFKAEPDVLKNYQNRWQYIMVDEYQDTNTAQFELIRLLAGTRHNLCVVGDDDQSIYKFRGANIRNILDFEHFYPEAKVVKLEQNYRSVQNILNAANSVIRNNSARKEKALWSHKEEGDRIHFRHFDTAKEEAEFVCRDILKEVNAGKSGFGDNAILYRTNAQSRMIEDEMVRENLPYRIVGGVSFYARREIKDLLAYLKTVDNGRDDIACKRIINVPKRGIGATSVNKLQLAADERGVSFFDAILHPEWADIRGAAAEKLSSFGNMILRLRVVSEEQGPLKLLKEILDITDYINQMEVDSEEEAEDRIENIEELISKVASYEEEHDEPNLSELLEEIALVADIDSVTEGEERTLLMTIHSAKGLEFKNVYLIGMEDGLFPSYMSISSGDAEIEEERRLAYVGITRAKEKLTISAAKARMVHGETQMNPLSRFVNEIPKSLFDIAPVKRQTYDGYYDSDTSDRGGFRRYDSYRDDEPISFTGFKRTPDEPVKPSSGVSPYAINSRYKAVARPKTTPEEDKPFVARKENLGLLTKGADIKASSTGGALSVGDRVRHIKFGDGTITNIVKEPRDNKITVIFDSYGQKIMYQAFAKLTKL